MFTFLKKWIRSCSHVAPTRAHTTQPLDPPPLAQVLQEAEGGGSRLQVAQRPSEEYCEALYQLIREALMSHHTGGARRIHKVGIANKVAHKIRRLKKRNEWPYGDVPSDLTIYRRIEELAEKGDFVMSIRKGSGWYRVNPDLFKR